MKVFRFSALLLSAATSFACERAKPPVRADSITAKPTGAPGAAPASTTHGTWDDGAGPIFLIAGSSPAQALVIAPDSASASAELAAIPHPASVTLLGRGGTIQTAELSAVSEAGVCSVGTLSAAPPPKPWSLGFLGGVIAPLPLDSIEAISRADSAALVVAVNRLASALPNDTAGRFAGLPFVVRSLWRLAIPDGPVVAIATVNRQLNQEATPLQEHTLLVVEHAVGDTTFSTAYSERSYGEEETIESREVLGAALIGPSRVPALFLVRDFGDATAYSLLERNATGAWHRRWTSARRHC